MRSAGFKFLLAVVVWHFAGVSMARADLAAGSSPGSSRANCVAAQPQSIAADWAADYAPEPVAASRTDKSDNSRREIQQLPPPPGSAALFLSAFASLGAIQIARSARGVHVGALPDWYHTGGARQIRHILVLDLEYPGVLPCPFAVPAIAVRPIHVEWVRDAQDGVQRLCRVLSSPRRGPPRAH